MLIDYREKWTKALIDAIQQYGEYGKISKEER